MLSRSKQQPVDDTTHDTERPEQNDWPLNNKHWPPQALRVCVRLSPRGIFQLGVHCIGESINYSPALKYWYGNHHPHKWRPTYRQSASLSSHIAGLCFIHSFTRGLHNHTSFSDFWYTWKNASSRLHETVFEHSKTRREETFTTDRQTNSGVFVKVDKHAFVLQSGGITWAKAYALLILHTIHPNCAKVIRGNHVRLDVLIQSSRSLQKRDSDNATLKIIDTINICGLTFGDAWPAINFSKYFPIDVLTWNIGYDVVCITSTYCTIRLRF